MASTRRHRLLRRTPVRGMECIGQRADGPNRHEFFGVASRLSQAGASQRENAQQEDIAWDNLKAFYEESDGFLNQPMAQQTPDSLQNGKLAKTETIGRVLVRARPLRVCASYKGPQSSVVLDSGAKGIESDSLLNFVRRLPVPVVMSATRTRACGRLAP